jgi:hypothetical protein
MMVNAIVPAARAMNKPIVEFCGENPIVDRLGGV